MLELIIIYQKWKMAATRSVTEQSSAICPRERFIAGETEPRSADMPTSW